MKRIIRNFVGVMLLALAIAATQIPVEVMEAASEASDFQLDGTTLVKYTGTAYAVSVPAEVKTIGEEAFSGNNMVKIVRLPKNLEVIEYGAFSYCKSLQKIQIPDSVTSVGSGAFACCPKLTTVEIGDGVSEMGTGVFAGCISLKNISLDHANTNFVMDKGVLYDDEMTRIYQYCPGRKDSVYIIPGTVTDIGKYAFWGCQNLESVSLNKELMSIAGYAFSNCRSLKTIEIPYSVHTIGAKAFEDCISLEEVSLLPSLRNIHETAFDGCINLTLYGEAGSVSGDYAEEFNSREKTVQAEYEDIFGDVILPENDGASDIEGGTTDGNVDLDENAGTSQNDDISKDDMGNMLGSTIIVGNQAVVFIDNSSLPVKQGSTTVDSVVSAGDIGTEDALSDPLKEPQKYDGKGIHIPKYTWFNGTIADQAYYKKKEMTSYSIPEGTTEIGEFAFARSGLTSIEVPEGVTTIGYAAFYHCDDLNMVTLPSTIEEIEPEAFSKTGFIENWKKSGSSTFLTAGNGILLAYNGDDSTVNIPEGVRIIAPGVFAKHSEITAVVLPDSLVSIDEGAFENCTRLQQVTGGSNLSKIEDRAFAGCPLDTIRIPDNVEEIGLGAYDYTKTNLRHDAKTVVFHGNIPIVTNEKTAQRLSNDEYRVLALNDVNYAVIDKELPVESLKGTVLDSESYGFKGIIVSINSDTDMTAEVRATTFTGEELAYFETSETVEIYGRQYTINGLERLEELAKNNADNHYDSEASVLILNKAPELETSRISAVLSENDDTYYLSIVPSDAAKERITARFHDLYNMDPPDNFVAYDISLLEEESGVTITKLGKQTVRITMPLPAGMGNGTLFILSSDANGQLEDVPYWYEEGENGRQVSFETSHFSDFGFYTSGTTMYAEGSVSNGKAVIGGYSQKDDSPNTGDFLHPKWFLAGGLFFAALAAFFLKKKPRKTS